MLLAILLAASAPAQCAHLPLTPATRAAMSAIVRTQPGHSLKGGEISDIMTGGRWRLIWGTPAAAERGVYFLRRDDRGRWHYIDVWGGVIAPEEREDTVRWARKRGKDLPAPLASCFVDALVAGK